MSVSLRKGQKINLTKGDPGFKKASVGLGWDANAYDTGGAFDLDASCFLLTSGGKVSSDDDFVFYGHLEHSSGAVVHTGDNRTGAGDGDDEVINVDFSKMPDWVERIAFIVTINDPNSTGITFGQVSNAFIRVVNADTNEEKCRYDLGEDFSMETVVVFGELYKHGGDWKFNPIGSGFNGGFPEICKEYGIDASYE